MTASAKTLSRRLAYGTLGALGANRLMCRRNAHALRVFTVHGVSTATEHDLWTPLRDQLETRLFGELLDALSDRHEFVSIDTAVEILSGRRSPARNAVLITFDDGYRNNFLEALPVLEMYDAPATFYVTTQAVSSRQPFWFDRLDYALQSAARQGTRVEFAKREFVFENPSRAAVADEYAHLRQHAKCTFSRDQEFVAALDELAGRVEQQTGEALIDILEQDHWASVLSADDLFEFAKHPLVTIGSHTVSHSRLSFANDQDIMYELQESRKNLETWTGKTVKHFAYPNGAYDDRAMQAVHKAGYASAVTSDPGANQVGCDLMCIKRLSIPSRYSRAEIQARASGLEAALVNRLRPVSSRNN
jgi:peptidoglycan/xylan/chitin deacetylase (PgdA/CDA1 family)